MSRELAAPHGAWSNTATPVAFLQQMSAVAEADIRKLIHDPFQLFSRMVQPVLWLVIFGQVFARTRAIPTGGLPYLDFMAPGILAQSVLFSAIFYGLSLIWEKDLGILQKFLVSPARRTALVAGRAISAATRGLAQTFFVYILATVLGVDVRFQIWAIAGVLAAVTLGSAVFSTLSLIAACMVKSRERFMGIGQVLTMPLFFASNAIYPLSMMPSWLRTLSVLNPLSYQVDAIRALMVTGGRSVFGLGLDFGMQALVLILLLGIATKLYPRIVN
jgi:ABC-2 type transport system permease protein